LEIPLEFGVETSGHIEVEAENNAIAAPPAGAALMTLEASVNAGGRASLAGQALAPAGGSFGFPLLAGNYQITVRNVPEGHKVKSVTAGAIDLLTTPYTVSPGEAAKDIQVTLTPSGLRNGSISGRILNADGTHAIAATVGALAAENTSGPIGAGGEICSRGTNPGTLFMGAFSSTAQTDSSGNYRMEKLPPGNYKIAVGVGLPFPGQALPRGTCGVTRIMSMPQYYPGTTDSAAGVAVTVGSGTAVYLEFAMIAPASEVPLGADGYFEVRNVPPGTYTACLIIDGGDVARIVDGPKTVTVVDRNLVDLKFTDR